MIWSPILRLLLGFVVRHGHIFYIPIIYIYIYNIILKKQNSYLNFLWLSNFFRLRVPCLCHVPFCFSVGRRRLRIYETNIPSPSADKGKERCVRRKRRGKNEEKEKLRKEKREKEKEKKIIHSYLASVVLFPFL